MELQSHHIPTSYQSYLQTFDNDPETAISRLKNRVEKRNAGAVGYFFLAWLYLKNGNKEQALDASIQAKILAPGSRLMSRLHYFISHPQSFNAWEPQKNHKTFKRDQLLDKAHPIHDLDGLITKLSSVESKRIKPKDGIEDDKRDLSEKSSDVDDIVTETLAVIHEKQKNYSAAILTYQRLKKVNPSKADFFDEQIARLNSKLEQEVPEE